MEEARYQLWLLMQGDAVSVGLCARCRHATVVHSARGSGFWRCRRSVHDPRFPKYPRLPVLRCTGFEPTLQESDSS